MPEGGCPRPISNAHFDNLCGKVTRHLEGKEVFVQDCWCGADQQSRLPVRVITAHAWHALFARNMFHGASPDEMASFAPGFTVIQAPECLADPKTDATRSSTFIVVHFSRRLILIGGTSYAGEIKKSIFSIMNYILPERGIMPMHCSANMGVEGDTAIFFGLSGTGKTTLSADSSRTLIGDDEHGWGDDGIFNFEGGCYAKVIRL